VVLILLTALLQAVTAISSRESNGIIITPPGTILLSNDKYTLAVTLSTKALNQALHAMGRQAITIRHIVTNHNQQPASRFAATVSLSVDQATMAEARVGFERTRPIIPGHT
jgi:hypothetical protein